MPKEVRENPSAPQTPKEGPPQAPGKEKLDEMHNFEDCKDKDCPHHKAQWIQMQGKEQSPVPMKAAEAKDLEKLEKMLKESVEGLSKSNELAVKLGDQVAKLQERLAKLEDTPETKGPAIRAVDKTLAGSEGVGPASSLDVLKKMYEDERSPLLKKALGERLATAEAANIYAAGPQRLM